jgi:hypothetical protein
MIHFLLFELEKTLVDNQSKVFAHALDALGTLKSFRTDTREGPQSDIWDLTSSI